VPNAGDPLVQALHVAGEDEERLPDTKSTRSHQPAHDKEVGQSSLVIMNPKTTMFSFGRCNKSALFFDHH
jgi:hypothetical protein